MPSKNGFATSTTADAVKPKTAQEELTEQILATLDELGGRNVGEDDLVWSGTRFVLPETMRGNISQVVDFLWDWDNQQNTTFSFTKKFNYRPYDGAAAFDRAMKSVFGTTGIGKATFSFFGVEPPEYVSVPSGPHGETVQVPWGKVELSLMDATFNLGMARSAEYGLVFAVQVQAPRRHRKRIEGFFKVVERELREHSLYKGHAITAHPQEPEFLDTKVDPAKVVYAEDVLTQLRVNLWSPIQHSDELRRLAIPLKRAVLLEGPNGTGKTLAGSLTSLVTEANGWTFILVRAGDDPFEALSTARIYAPAVVWIEDLERLASAKKDNAEITRLLDALDNVQGKGVEVMAGFTSNFADKLVKDVVRPGRLDAIIKVAALDHSGYEKLIRALVPADLLDPDVDFEKVVAAYDGFLPSFATEAAQRSLRYSIARNDGHAERITTEDLVDAAHGMRTHLELMENALTRGQERPVLDSVLRDTIAEVVMRVLSDTRVVYPESGGRDVAYELAKTNGSH